MRAGIIVTGTGPIAIETSCDFLTDRNLVNKLTDKGITEYIGFEVPLESVKERYGYPFSVVMGDLHETDDPRSSTPTGIGCSAISRLRKWELPSFRSPGSGCIERPESAPRHCLHQGEAGRRACLALIP
jgi:hypothetical protein